MNNRFLAAAAFVLFACGDPNPANNDAAGSTDTTAASANFFPVKDFLQGEIAKVDSLPVGIKRYRSSAAVNDSGYIQRDEFRKLAAEFLPAALSDSIFKKEFKETSFIDKTTGGATFFYNTSNNDLQLRRVDVVTETTDTYDKIKSIYLEKMYEQGDSSVTKKLFWNPEREFQVITQVSVKAEDPETELVKVVWDNRE